MELETHTIGVDQDQDLHSPPSPSRAMGSGFVWTKDQDQDLHSPPSPSRAMGSGIVSPSSRDPTMQGLSAQPPPQPSTDPGFLSLLCDRLPKPRHTNASIKTPAKPGSQAVIKFRSRAPVHAQQPSQAVHGQTGNAYGARPRPPQLHM